MKIILEAPEMILGTVEEKLNEASGKSEKNYYIRGIFSTIGEKNKNGRTYPRHLWEREISKYQSEIRSNSVNSLMEVITVVVLLEMVVHPEVEQLT